MEEKNLWALAATLFKLIDQANTREEIAALSQLMHNAATLFDDYHNLHPNMLHPDLGLELSEFADLKDDYLANSGNELLEPMNKSRSNALEILQEHEKVGQR